MYHILSDISNFISTPFVALFRETKSIPLLASFLLGIVGAMAPCQLTGNISAITFYGNKSMQKTGQLAEAGLFILGKITVFSAFGLIVFAIGHEFQESITGFFQASRKAIGPFIVLLGLFLAGLFKFRFLNKAFSFVPKVHGSGKWGSFLMGAGFSVAFCPTMFMLFFLMLMPMALRTSYGSILPSIFAVGTSLPLIVFLAVVWFLGMNGALLRKSRKIGEIVQKSAGIILIVMGIMDTITYW